MFVSSLINWPIIFNVMQQSEFHKWSTKWQLRVKRKNERWIAKSHRRGSFDRWFIKHLFLSTEREKKNTHTHKRTYISHWPSAATRNFVHEYPEDWLVVNPISACGFEVVFPTRSSSFYHCCSRCQGLLGSSFFTLNNFPFGWTIRVHPTTVLPGGVTFLKPGVRPNSTSAFRPAKRERFPPSLTRVSCRAKWNLCASGSRLLAYTCIYPGCGSENKVDEVIHQKTVGVIGRNSSFPSRFII